MEESKSDTGYVQPDTAVEIPVEIAQPSTGGSSPGAEQPADFYGMFRSGLNKAKFDAEEAAEVVVPKVREYATKAALGAAYGAAYGTAFGVVFSATVAKSFVPNKLRSTLRKGVKDAKGAAAAVVGSRPDEAPAPAGA